MSTKDWATWLPGNPVHPGSVGVFNRERCFDHGETLEDFGITCARLSDETEVSPIYYSTFKGFEFGPEAAGSSAPGLDVLGEAHVAADFAARAEHDCLIEMRNPTERKIKNQRQVKEAVLAQLGDGQWGVDLHIVMRRTRCTSGLAVVSRAAMRSGEFKTGASFLGVINDLKLALASGRSSSRFLITRFIETSTPSFGDVVRVKRELWPKLLPWRSDGRYLTDPSGNRFLPANLPPELSAYAPRDRCYDPASSAMSQAELSTLTVEDVFEEVTALAGEDEPSSTGEPGTGPAPAGLGEDRRYTLPPSTLPGTLAAACGEDTPVLLDAAFEDGLVRVTVYDRGSGRYWLEVTLRQAGSEPTVVTIRYQATDGASRDLIIPVAGGAGGASSSIVSLPDYKPRTSGQAGLTAPGSWQDWPAEVVRTSVLAAVGNATARAWERLALLVPADTGDVIGRALRDLRGTA